MPIERNKVMTVRLTEEEEALREALEKHLGTDGSSVMRQAMLKLARDLNVEPLTQKKRPSSKA